MQAHTHTYTLTHFWICLFQKARSLWKSLQNNGSTMQKPVFTLMHSYQDAVGGNCSLKPDHKSCIQTFPWQSCKTRTCFTVLTKGCCFHPKYQSVVHTGHRAGTQSPNTGGSRCDTAPAAGIRAFAALHSFLALLVLAQKGKKCPFPGDKGHLCRTVHRNTCSGGRCPPLLGFRIGDFFYHVKLFTGISSPFRVNPPPSLCPNLTSPA